MIARIICYLLICFSAVGALLVGRDILIFGARPLWVATEAFLMLNAIYLISSTVWQPPLTQIEAAARLLHQAGAHHGWWKPYVKSYDEMAATDPIAKSEFDGIVERMLRAARSR